MRGNPPNKPEVFHVHVDHLGTPREITDTDGHLVWTANYAAWGKAITSNPPRRFLTRQGNTVAEVVEEQAEPLECNLRFQGQYADAESGLHYNRFRYYDPEVGRFLRKDPIGRAGGENFYAYAPSPVNMTDPFGLAYIDHASNNGGQGFDIYAICKDGGAVGYIGQTGDLTERTPQHIKSGRLLQNEGLARVVNVPTYGDARGYE